MRNYITAKQLGDRLAGRSVRSIQRDVQSGALPEPYRVSGTLMWDADEVDKHIAEQSNKSTGASPMIDEFKDYTEGAKTALDDARESLKNIEARYRAERNRLNVMQIKLRGAELHNANEIEARADALANDEDRPKGEIIDIPKLEQDIAITEATVNALKDKVDEARIVHKGAAGDLVHGQQQTARQWLVYQGMDRSNRFSFDKIKSMTAGELLALSTVVTAWKGRKVSLEQFIADHTRPEGEPARDAVWQAIRPKVFG